MTDTKLKKKTTIPGSFFFQIEINMKRKGLESEWEGEVRSRSDVAQLAKYAVPYQTVRVRRRMGRLAVYFIIPALV